MTSYGGYVYEASDIVIGGLVNLVFGSAAYVILQRRHKGFFSKIVDPSAHSVPLLNDSRSVHPPFRINAFSLLVILLSFTSRKPIEADISCGTPSICACTVGIIVQIGFWKPIHLRCD